jgi:hypothetical protein
MSGQEQTFSEGGDNLPRNRSHVTTPHFARTMPNYILLPIIPERQERNPSEKRK